MKYIGSILLACAPIVALGQQALPPIKLITAPDSNELAVQTGIETHILQSSETGLILNHPGVDPDSVLVSLNGLPLNSGKQFTVDSSNGTINFGVQTKPGDVVNVTYRYGKAYETVSHPGSNLLSFGLAGGGAKLGLGLMSPERLADGSVFQSRVMALGNNFTSHGFGLQGGILFGSRLQSDAVGFAGTSTLGNTEKFVSEMLSQKVSGGTFSIGYQDISANFHAFNSLEGFTDDQVSALSKEAGLKKQSIGLSGVKIGGLSLDSQIQKISDGKNGLTSSSINLKSKSADISFSQSQVDQSFSRFADLGEAQDGAWQKQAGLSVRSTSATFQVGHGGSFSLNNRSYSGASGNLNISELGLKNGAYSFGVGSAFQSKAFNQYAGIADTDKASYTGLDGLDRKWLNFAHDNGKSIAADFLNYESLSSAAGSMQSIGLGLSGKNWSIGHQSLGASVGFANLATMQPAQAQAQINELAKLFPTSAAVNAGAEQGAYMGLTGINRSFTELKFDPNKATSIDFHDSRFAAADGNAIQDVLNFSSGNYKLGYTTSSIGPGFTEVDRLMGFEKTSLGGILGSNMSSLSLGIALGKGSEFTASNFNTSDGSNSALRNLVQLTSKNLNFMLANRQVSSGFAAIGSSPDSERGLLATLAGFDQSVSQLSWNLSKNLSLTESGYVQTQQGQDSPQLAHQQTALNYQNAKEGIQLGVTQTNDQNALPNAPIASSNDRVITFNKTAKDWSLKVQEETNNITTPSSVTAPTPAQQSYVAKAATLSVKVSPSTTVSTEQSQTNYASGQTQTSNTNTISTQISKRMGISVSETHVADPETSTNDQQKRDYGFWYDLGHGLVFRYGIQRQNLGPDTGNSTSMFSLGQNNPNLNSSQLGSLGAATVGGFSVAGGYGANEWETPTGAVSGPASSVRTQAFSNIRVGTAKPMNFGMFKNTSFGFSQDTAADSFNWIKEDKQFGFSTQLLGTALGVGYHSQADQAGNESIDRSINFATDPKESRFLSASIAYKMRTLPNNQKTMIRNFEIAMRPAKRFTISNALVTNPDVPNGAAILGSVPQATRSNTLGLAYDSTATTSLGASWQELVNDQTHTYSTTTGLDFTLFKTTSPLHIFYGFSNAFNSTSSRSLIDRWSIQFDQRAGPHQTLNLFIGDISYAYAIPGGANAHNLTARVQYSWKF